MGGFAVAIAIWLKQSLLQGTFLTLLTEVLVSGSAALPSLPKGWPDAQRAWQLHWCCLNADSRRVIRGLRIYAGNSAGLCWGRGGGSAAFALATAMKRLVLLLGEILKGLCRVRRGSKGGSPERIG